MAPGIPGPQHCPPCRCLIGLDPAGALGLDPDDSDSPINDAVSLPGPVHAVKTEATDYLHTRASVLRNHLIETCNGNLFCFVSAPDAARSLHVMRIQCDASAASAEEGSKREAALIHSLAGEACISSVSLELLRLHVA